MHWLVGRCGWGKPDAARQCATVLGSQVEVVESFTHLGCLIHCSGSSEPEIKRRANIVLVTSWGNVFSGSEYRLWRSNITLETKLRLYNTCILPIFLYSAETWSVTVTLSLWRTIDALDNWCLRRILNIHWLEFVTNDEIRSRTGQPFLSYQTLSAVAVCFSLDISTEPTPGRIITELSRPAQRDHLTTGDGGFVVQGNPGSEPWRPTCDLWILDWRPRRDALKTDRLGGNSWQRLRLLRCSWRRINARTDDEYFLWFCLRRLFKCSLFQQTAHRL